MKKDQISHSDCEKHNAISEAKNATQIRVDACERAR